MITPMPVSCWPWLVVWLILYILKRPQAAAIANTDIAVYDFVSFLDLPPADVLTPNLSSKYPL